MKGKGLGIHVGDDGIGSILNQHLLMVPPNQRSYAWEGSHVQTLFEDLSAAMKASENQTYFLGTVVLTQGQDRLEVADGQQRLATTSILIAAIRDLLNTMGVAERKAADKYESEYLLIYDEMTGEHTPKLRLNHEDNDFFLNNVLNPDVGSRVGSEPTVPSHKRLYGAAKIAREHVANIVSQFGKAEKAKELYRWVKFIRESAIAISIRVPDHINAFTMFETLNDRGLRASQTDILKNYLFGRAQDRLEEIQTKWSGMVATIETAGDEDMLLTYLRHYWTVEHGHTLERELAAKVKEHVTGRQQAITLVLNLDSSADDYVGLLDPLDFQGWPNIDKQTRAYIYVITRVLAIEQLRPLMLSVIRRFEPSEARSAMRMFLMWSVRFLVAGSGGGGPLDRSYAPLAKDVTDGHIKTTAMLRSRVSNAVLRTDDEFRASFAKCRVTKTQLARYYLRAIELYKTAGMFPELSGVMDDNYTGNLEHVMPQSEAAGWPIEEPLAQQFRKRLGNMTLITPQENVKLGNKPFTEKRPVYLASPIIITQEVGAFSAWTTAEIDKRQSDLSEIALKIWRDES